MNLVRSADSVTVSSRTVKLPSRCPEANTPTVPLRRTAPGGIVNSAIPCASVVAGATPTSSAVIPASSSATPGRASAPRPSR
jgi:hypothetical protein